MLFVLKRAGWTSLLLASAGLLYCSTAKPPARAAADEPSVPDVPPQALVGDWLMETRVGDQAVEGKLHFSLTGGILAGSVTSKEGDARELSNITIKGDRISWDVGRQHAEGTISGSSMKGTLKMAGGGRRRRGGDSEGEGDSGEGSPTPRSGGGGRGGRYGRRGGGGGGAAAKITWSAFKSSAPLAGETSAPAPTPTP